MPWRLALGPNDLRRVNDRFRKLVPRSVRTPAGPSGRVDQLVAAAVRAAGRSGHLGEKDRRSARDEAALAGPEWLGHPVAQNAQLTERMTKVLTTGTFGANAP